MASEYNLALKATLDTSQVQQELQRLKHSYTAGSDDGNSFSKGAPGAAHMQKIEVQLTRLGQSISSLQRAIEQLARAESRAAGSGNSHPAANGQNTLPIAPPKASSGKTNWKNWLDSKDYRKFNNFVKSTLAKELSTAEQLYLMYRSGISSSKDPLFAHKMLSSPLGKELFGNSFNYEKEVAQYLARQQEAMKMQRASMRQNRQFAALIGGLLLSGAGDIATSLGYEGFGRSIANIGEGITAGAGAGMAATMAGLGGKASGIIGVAVGFATVITKNIASMEQLAQAVNKAAQAFEENYKALHARTIGVHDSIMGIRQQDRADLLLESGNIEEARKQAKYWKDSSESAKLSLLGMEDPIAAERHIREQAEKAKAEVDKYIGTSNAEDWFGKDSGVVEYLTKMAGFQTYGMRRQDILNLIDSNAQTLIADMQQRYKDTEAYMNRSKSYAGMYEEVVKQIEAADLKKLQESNAEVAARVALAERNDLSISRYRAAGQANATQAFANDILGSKLTGPLEKFNKLSEELDKLRNLKNNSLMQAYGIAKDISENGSKMTSEDLKRELAKQGRFEQDAAYAEQRIGIIESALANISKSTLAPDLSHVTSLAQYGFSMGERDDSVERMEKYYSKSLNLQQQIKDKLQEGVKTEAVYN